DRSALLALDTPAMQRLRYVRQVGHAFLVYPGATHTRFEHALGAYHLTKQALASLEERGERARVDEDERVAVRLAALLHDIGHYPFSHALEEAGFPHHEALGVAKLTQGELGDSLRRIGGPDLAGAVGALIRGTSDSPLQGLISGSLDLDKIDYLSRDARMCGVPYGTVDVDRLLATLTLVPTESGRYEVGVLEKGVSALESLLFAKYQMYRNVYWHHAVRSATAMYKRMVEDALRAGAIDAELLPSYTDEGLLHRLEHAAPSTLLDALKSRRLYKRALEWPASQLDDGFGEWVATDRERTRMAEDTLAAELGVKPGEVLLDFPIKTQMLGLDIPVKRRGGEIEMLTGEGWPGTINLPSLAEALYTSARWLRVFVVRRIDIPREPVWRTLGA